MQQVLVFLMTSIKIKNIIKTRNASFLHAMRHKKNKKTVILRGLCSRSYFDRQIDR
jgi:hypothetical protein